MNVRTYCSKDKKEILSKIPSSHLRTRENQLQMAEYCDMYSCFVSEGDSGINGFALLRDLADGVSFYLEQITIQKEKRRKGIGTNLMKSIFQYLGTEKHMSLCVDTDNEAAIRFYESLGFLSTGFTKDYRKGLDKYWYAIDF